VSSAEETLLVSKEQLLSRLRKAPTGELPPVVTEFDETIVEMGKNPFEDTAPHKAVHATEKEAASRPNVYDAQTISVVDALLQLDTPLGNEGTNPITQMPREESVFDQIDQSEYAAVNTDADLPLVQTRTHMMAMASQLQQMKERLREQSRATGIKRLDEPMRQAEYHP
jgi:hypothetical protein